MSFKNGFPTREEVEKLRKLYPEGTTLQLDFMDDAFAPPAGTIGKVDIVDDNGVVHMIWQNGSSLGLIVGVDKFHRV